MLSHGVCALTETIDRVSVETSAWRGGMGREEEWPPIPSVVQQALEGACILGGVGWDCPKTDFAGGSEGKAPTAGCLQMLS